MAQDPTAFLLSIHGQLEYAEAPEFSSLYCRYQIVHGADWVVTSGLEEGATQTAIRQDDICVWNFPVEITFKSTNPFGWPQIVVCVFGLDGLGRDVPRGYGSIHFPVTPGSHECFIDLFVPKSSSSIQQFTSWLFGERPEYVDSTIVARGQGRDVTRVCSQGRVKMTCCVVLKDMHALGYDNGDRRTLSVPGPPRPAAAAAATAPIASTLSPQQQPRMASLLQSLRSTRLHDPPVLPPLREGDRQPSNPRLLAPLAAPEAEIGRSVPQQRLATQYEGDAEGPGQ